MKQIEIFHKVTEESARCYFAMVPFDIFLRMMAMQMMVMVKFYVNSFA